MITAWYTNEQGHTIEYELADMEAVYNVAQMLSKSLEEVEYLFYGNGLITDFLVIGE